MFKKTDSGVDYSEDYKRAVLDLYNASIDLLNTTYEKRLEYIDHTGLMFALDDIDSAVDQVYAEYSDLSERMNTFTHYNESVGYIVDALPIIFNIIDDKYDTSIVGSELILSKYNICLQNIKDILDTVLSGRPIEQGEFVSLITILELAKNAKRIIQRHYMTFSISVPKFFVDNDVSANLKSTLNSFQKAIG